MRRPAAAAAAGRRRRRAVPPRPVAGHRLQLRAVPAGHGLECRAVAARSAGGHPTPGQGCPGWDSRGSPTPAPGCPGSVRPASLTPAPGCGGSVQPRVTDSSAGLSRLGQPGVTDSSAGLSRLGQPGVADSGVRGRGRAAARVRRLRRRPGPARRVGPRRGGAGPGPAPRRRHPRRPVRPDTAGATALQPRLPDPDEVTDTGARRARSAFRLADEPDRPRPVRRGRVRRGAGAGPPVGHLPGPDAHRRPPSASASGWASTGSGRPGRSTPCRRSASRSIGMLVVARPLRRRYGHELDLLTAIVTVGGGHRADRVAGRVHPAGSGLP